MVTNAGVLSVAAGCHRLRKLNLRGCHHVSDEGVIALTEAR
jgi:hypothetical protein